MTPDTRNRGEIRIMEQVMRRSSRFKKYNLDFMGSIGTNFWRGLTYVCLIDTRRKVYFLFFGNIKMQLDLAFKHNVLYIIFSRKAHTHTQAQNLHPHTFKKNLIGLRNFKVPG